MAVLAFLCLAIGLASPLLAGALQTAVVSWAPEAQAASLALAAPTQWITLLGLALVLGTALLAGILKLMPTTRAAKPVLTWDCGYAKPTARMQYTGSSLTDALVKMFSFALWPRREPSRQPELFAKAWSFQRLVPDVVLDRWLVPFALFFGKHLPRIRIFQQGQTHVYVLYILVVTILLFALAGLWRPS
jgi:hypothetical protein